MDFTWNPREFRAARARARLSLTDFRYRLIEEAQDAQKAEFGWLTACIPPVSTFARHYNLTSGRGPFHQPKTLGLPLPWGRVYPQAELLRLAAKILKTSESELLR